MTTKYMPDTNALINKPAILDELAVDGNLVILPYAVIEELDKIKSEFNSERGFRAREAFRHMKALRKNGAPIHIELVEGVGKNDNLIIESAKRNNATLVTGDFAVQFKAEEQGVTVIEVASIDVGIKYTGVKELILSTSSKEDADLIDETYESVGYNIHELLMNQYLLIKDKDKPIFDKIDKKKIVDYELIEHFKWTGTELTKDFFQTKKHKKENEFVKALNPHQACAIDLLMNQDIPIKIVAGTYGSGKTLLSVRVGQFLIDRFEAYKKMLMVRNPLGSGEEIGFIPGDKEEKIEAFFKPVIQSFANGEQDVKRMTFNEQLEKEIPYYMKGLSIPDTYIIVDEAEDLDVNTIKLIGTRLAEGACITFAGDYKQAESKYTWNNGLLHSIDKLKGNPLVGIVVLPEDVRSEASKVFADL